MSLLIGVASYLAPENLKRTLESIRTKTAGDWRCFIIHNAVENSEADRQARSIARYYVQLDSRFDLTVQPNSGYCGAVNHLIERAASAGYEFCCHCDNDIEIHTQGWNQQMEALLRAHADCAWVFPGDGHYPLNNGRYRECLWHAGYCWMLSMAARAKMAEREAAMFQPTYLRAGFLNEHLGHHEEVDYMIRLRLAGFTTACLPAVSVTHHENATRANPADHQPGGRIHDGVVRWMNFWNRYFSGDQLKYSMTDYDPRALRYTDWTVDALYLERFTLAHVPQLNAHPETVTIPGVGQMDAIKVLKPKGCYVNRAI